jgi:hypothetical protein
MMMMMLQRPPGPARRQARRPSQWAARAPSLAAPAAAPGPGLPVWPIGVERVGGGGGDGCVFGGDGGGGGASCGGGCVCGGRGGGAGEEGVDGIIHRRAPRHVRGVDGGAAAPRRTLVVQVSSEEACGGDGAELCGSRSVMATSDWEKRGRGRVQFHRSCRQGSVRRFDSNPYAIASADASRLTRAAQSGQQASCAILSFSFHRAAELWAARVIAFQCSECSCAPDADSCQIHVPNLQK